MSVHVQRMRRGERSLPAFSLLVVPAGLLLGVIYALSAYQLSPWTLPALIFVVIAGRIAYFRPEIGVALGLAFVPARTFGFDSRQTTYYVVAWSAYLVAVSYHRSRVRGLSLRLPLMSLFVLLYLFVSMFSLTQAGNATAGQGLARNIFTGTLLFIAAVWSIRDRRSLVIVLTGFAAGGLFVGLHALRDYILGNETTFGFITSAGEFVGRLSAGFNQPNELGGFLVVVVPLAITGAIISKRWRGLFIAAAVAAPIGVYASFSRGALIALAIVPFVFLRGWRLWVVGPLVVLLLLTATPGLVKERFATLTSSGTDVGTRADIWRVAFKIWEAHPVTGVGLGNFGTAYANIPVAGKQFLPNTVYEPPPHAHDLFLNLLAEEGIFGLLTFLGILVISARIVLRLRAGPERWLRTLGSGLLATLIAFLVHDLFDVTILDPQTGLYIFTLFGVIAACGRNWVYGTDAAETVTA